PDRHCNGSDRCSVPLRADRARTAEVLVMLEIDDLSVRYGRVAVLEGIDARFAPGTLTALIGPNGSGKSSLLRAIAGLQPHAGAVRLAGQGLTMNGRGEMIAYMPQDSAPTSSLTLMEVVLLGRLGSLALSVPGELVTAAEDALARFGLGHLAHRSLDQVSGGQRQLVFLAQALFRAPHVLLLDEPTSALDLRHQLIVLDRIRRRVRTDSVIAIAAIHDLNLAAQFADQVLCLHDGAIDGHGAPREILTRSRLERLMGIEAEIVPSESAGVRISALRAIG
ncbi:MAG: ABC transporter ATP-binding protein, partial [Pseudomonadota bacterium]